MQKPKWNPQAETNERLEAIRDGHDAGMRSHMARIVADKELVRRANAAQTPTRHDFLTRCDPKAFGQDEAHQKEFPSTEA